jgi:hypothetical protein
MRLTLLLVAVCAAGAGLHAAQTDTAHKTVLLTGCLQRVDADPGFTLVQAETLSKATPEQVSAPAVGAAANTPAAKEGNKDLARYELRPASGIGDRGVGAKELQQHVGKRVEITARPVEQPIPSAPSATVTAPKLSPPLPEPPQKIRLTVTAIKPLGTMC